MNHQTTLSTILIAVAGLFAQPGESHAAGIAVEQPVSLRIAADTPAAEAYVQIRKSAGKACASRAIYAHKQRVRTRECEARFVDDAVAAFDRQELTAVHLERTREQTRALAASQ